MRARATAVDQATGETVQAFETADWSEIAPWWRCIQREYPDADLRFRLVQVDDPGDRVTQVRAALADALRVRDIEGPYPGDVEEVADEILLVVTQLERSGMAYGLIDVLTRKLALRHWGVDA